METSVDTAPRTERVLTLLTEDEKTEFVKMCKARRTTPEKFIRDYIERELISYELDKLEGVCSINLSG